MLLPERDPPCASLRRISAAEKEAISAFRQEITTPVDTVTALWFLRARKLNVKKASTMYTTHLEWRKSYGADKLIHTAPTGPPKALEALNEAFAPLLLSVADRKARPVMYLAYGKLDSKALADQGVSQDLLMRRWIRGSWQRVRAAQATLCPAWHPTTRRSSIPRSV